MRETLKRGVSEFITPAPKPRRKKRRADKAQDQVFAV
jgi:hypothetical protein